MSSGVGRPRDTEIDTAVVAATLAVLSEVGYEALTFAAVAERAGTTRPALYRRFETKAELAAAALGSLSSATAPTPSGDHFRDLVAELRAFRNGIESTAGVSLVGAMLTSATDDEVREQYRTLVVVPRRTRLRAILSAAVADGRLSASRGEVDLAVAMCTGSWYAMALAGERPPKVWPRRAAALVWRSLGGEPPVT